MKDKRSLQTNRHLNHLSVCGSFENSLRRQPSRVSAQPDTLERTWNSLQQVMKKGALDPLTKELIYVAVSMTNSCEYCIRSHTLAAKKKGMSEEMLKELIAVVAMANETNRLVESYQVKIDDFLK